MPLEMVWKSLCTCVRFWTQKVGRASLGYVAVCLYTLFLLCKKHFATGCGPVLIVLISRIKDNLH